MGAEHLPVEALARGPEAANRARVGVEHPDRSTQDRIGEAVKGRPRRT